MTDSKTAVAAQGVQLTAPEGLNLLDQDDSAGSCCGGSSCCSTAQ